MPELFGNLQELVSRAQFSLSAFVGYFVAALLVGLAVSVWGRTHG